MMHDQLLQLSRQTAEGGWRALVRVGIVGAGGARDHVVICKGRCGVGVLARRHHLEVCGCGKLGQIHVGKLVRRRCADDGKVRLQ